MEKNLLERFEKLSSEDFINVVMPPLVRIVRQKAYIREYQSKVTDAEVAGIIISKLFLWDGRKILEVAESALEDANFRQEAEKVAEMRKGL